MNKKEQTQRPIYTAYSGPALLETSLLNKESAFSQEERRVFNLEGLLPHAIETIEQQLVRAYQQYSSFKNDLDKHIYLRNIQDTNETLYYRLIIDNLAEMMPIIYTPTVGLACQLFSRIYRRKRGVFISYPNREHIEATLQNITKRKIKVIVLTDSERILGLGDQGIGGMGIPIGKLALYSACGGISPAYTLPVTLDVGTNNQQLLDDPMYMGWRHSRISGSDYYDFVDQFIKGVMRRWPAALIQFEDFAQSNATPLLHKYQNAVCAFNDDIQGTAAVTVGTLLAACRTQKTTLKDHRIVFVGAGSAGCGIAEQIITHMQAEGLSESQALEHIYLTNSKGLLTENTTYLKPFQEKFVKSISETKSWAKDSSTIDLLTVVREAKPSIVIGVAGFPGLMSEAVIKTLFSHCNNPIVLPLSNPNSRVEATPEDIINWTEGKAIVATGSPFPAVEYAGRTYPIAQCNNSYIFPGVGLGVIASGAKRVTEKMFMAASETLADCSPLALGEGDDLLPELDDIRQLSKKIAAAVANQAITDGVADQSSAADIQRSIDANFWYPQYRNYRRISV